MPFVLAPLFVDPVTAAAAIALIIAGILLADMLGSLIGKVSIGPVSFNPGAWFKGIAHSIESWAVNAFDSVIAPVGHWLNGIAYDAYHNLSSVLGVLTHLGDQIAHIVNTSIPDAIAAQFANIMGIVDRDIGTVNVKIDNAVSSLEGDITTAIDHQFANIMGIVDSDIGALHVYVDNAVSGAEADASQALSTVERTLTGDISTAIQSAEAAAAAAEAALSQDISGAIAAADAAVAGLQGVITGDITSVNALIATIAATAATALSVAQTVAGEFESCAVTTCDGPNNLSNLLNNLLGLATDAEFAAWLAYAISSPKAAGQTFASIGQTLYSDADSLMDTLLSI